MKKTVFAVVTLTAAVLPALAAESYTDRARVIGVTAITERVPISREQCWNDRVRTYEERRVTRSDTCLLYTSPSPRDGLLSRMPSSA